MRLDLFVWHFLQEQIPVVIIEHKCLQTFTHQIKHEYINKCILYASETNKSTRLSSVCKIIEDSGDNGNTTRQQQHALQTGIQRPQEALENPIHKNKSSAVMSSLLFKQARAVDNKLHVYSCY